MDIGNEIRSARKKSNLTQAQLASKSGVAIITIRQYEAGKRQPRIEQLQAIANALEIPVGELMGLSDVDAFWAEFDESVQINRHLEKLNDEGKKEAVKRVEELTEIPKYQRQETPTKAPQTPPEGTEDTLPESPSEGAETFPESQEVDWGKPQGDEVW